MLFNLLKITQSTSLKSKPIDEYGKKHIHAAAAMATEV